MQARAIRGHAQTEASMPEPMQEAREIITKDFWIDFRAVFAGVLVTLGLQFSLHLLGRALGLTLTNPAAVTGVRPLTGGPIVWTLLIPIATFFFGGLIASMSAKTTRSGQGFLHGLVVWGFCLAFFAALIAVGGTTTAAPGATRLTADDYWVAFFSTILALIGALFGGYLGSLPLHRSVYGRGAFYRSDRTVTP